MCKEAYKRGYEEGFEAGSALNRKTGHWVLDPNGMDWNIPAWVCSECGCKNDNIPPCIKGRGTDIFEVNPYNFAGSRFCPNCGAIMIPKE